MKLNKWLYGVLALGMLAACSDDIVTDNGENSEEKAPNASGYLAVEIKLPQESGTRAGNNDDFTDGTANEYAVNNAMIVVFKGANEKAATFVKAQNLKKPFFTNLPTDDNITSSYIAAIQVDELGNSNDHYWGLVVLNRNESSTTIDTGDYDNGIEDNTEEVKLGGVPIRAGEPFSQVMGIITSNGFVKTTTPASGPKTYSEFFMTNAPMANYPGEGSDPVSDHSDFKVQYLADLGNRTYETMDEAKSNVSSCIYVERAVAKVTCGLGQDPWKLKLSDENGEIDAAKYTISAEVRYALTNTNKKSYLVRNVEFPGDHFKWNLLNKGLYRMVGAKAMPALQPPYHGDKTEYTNLYRTYWCVDPNYDTEMDHATKTDKNVVTNPADLTSIRNPLYCKENTFTVANQNYGNTTLALFEVDFNIQGIDTDDNLYIRDGDNSTVYVNWKAAASNELSRLYNNDFIKKTLNECRVEGFTETITDVQQYLNIGTTVDKNSLLITSITLKQVSNKFDAASVAKFTAELGSPETEGSKASEILNDVNNMDDITVFTGGKSYYQIPIRHFSDDYTPWTEVTGTTTEAVYNGGVAFGNSDGHAAKFLGRYGMVRNNWYQLNLSGITALGSPTIPPIDLDLSDDNLEEKRYIGVEIHILSWAKRTQSVNFDK